MEMLAKPVLLLALAMTLALGIERMLELMRAVADYREARNGTMQKWQKVAEQARGRIEARLELARAGGKTAFTAVLNLIYRYLSPAPPGTDGLIVISADQVRNLSLQMMCKIYGILLGIFFAAIFDLDLFQLVKASIPQGGSNQPGGPGWPGMILSGIAMGLGAGPVHKLITALERVRDARR